MFGKEEISRLIRSVSIAKVALKDKFMSILLSEASWQEIMQALGYDVTDFFACRLEDKETLTIIVREPNRYVFYNINESYGYDNLGHDMSGLLIRKESADSVQLNRNGIGFKEIYFSSNFLYTLAEVFDAPRKEDLPKVQCLRRVERIYLEVNNIRNRLLRLQSISRKLNNLT